MYLQESGLANTQRVSTGVRKVSMDVDFHDTGIETGEEGTALGFQVHESERTAGDGLL